MNKKYNYGVKISKQWYWYENWIDVVRDYCQKNDFQINQNNLNIGTGTGMGKII